MLEQSRRQGASIFIYLIFSLLIVIFVINFSPGAGKGQGCGGTSNSILLVNGKDVTQTSYHIYYSNPYNRASGAQHRYVAIEQLIRRELLAQEAERRGLRVNDDLAQEEMKKGYFYIAGQRVTIPGIFDENGLWSLRQFKNWVGMLNVSKNSYIGEQRRGMLAYMMAQLIEDGVQVSRDEALSHYLFENNTVQYDIVAFKPDAYKSAMKLTDADVDRFLGTHGSEVEARYKADERTYKGTKPALKLRQIFIAKLEEPKPEAPPAPGGAAGSGADKAGADKAGDKSDKAGDKSDKAADKTGDKSGADKADKAGAKAAGDKAADKTGDKAADKTGDKTADKAGAKAAGDKAADKTGDKTADKAGAKAAGDKAADKTADKAAGDKAAAEKSGDNGAKTADKAGAKAAGDKAAADKSGDKAGAKTADKTGAKKKPVGMKIEDAKAKLEAARTAIKSGKEKFVDAAKQLNTEDAMKASGGDLGWHTADNAMLGDKAVSDAVKTLKPGEMTPVITTDSGAYLLIAEDTRSGDLKYDQVKHDIAKDLARDVWSKEAAKRAAISALDKAEAGKLKLDQLYEKEQAPANQGIDPQQLQQLLNDPNMSPEDKQKLLQMLQGQGKQGSIVFESQDKPAGWYEQANGPSGSAAPAPAPRAPAAPAAGSNAGSAAPAANVGQAPAAPAPADVTASKDQLPEIGDVARPTVARFGPAPRGATMPGLGTAKDAINAVFDVLAPGDLAKKVYDGDGGYIVVQLVSRSQPKVEDFNKEADKLTDELRKERAQAFLQDWMKERCEKLAKDNRITPNAGLLRETDDKGNPLPVTYKPCISFQ